MLTARLQKLAENLGLWAQRIFARPLGLLVVLLIIAPQGAANEPA